MTDLPRQQAFLILLKIEKDKSYSNLILDSYLKSFDFDNKDRSFITRLVYGVIERKITLDYIFNGFLKQGASKLKPEVLTLLRMGTYQIVFFDKIPKSAAVNETVKLAKKYCPYASGLINAVLRKTDTEIPEYNGEDTALKISIAYSVPTELVKFFIYHYGTENTEEFFKKTLCEKPLYLRMNNTKTDNSEFEQILKTECDFVKNTVFKEAYLISSNKPVYELTAYKNGLFHIEDISSQLCVKALDPQENEKILDVCSAPGGKTFTIAETMNGTGKVVSCDIYPQRVDLIKKGALRLSLSSVFSVVNDATVYNESLGLFDRVLCDVPCSGLGIIGKKPEIKYKKLDDIKELLPVQKKILDVSSMYVKKGGTLVYSTCSVNPNENRKICDAFLKEHLEFCSVKALPDVERCVDEGDYLTLMPHINGCDGFFIAEFKRKDI